jgi:hypothetical protein
VPAFLTILTATAPENTVAFNNSPFAVYLSVGQGLNVSSPSLQIIDVIQSISLPANLNLKVGSGLNTKQSVSSGRLGKSTEQK